MVFDWFCMGFHNLKVSLIKPGWRNAKYAPVIDNGIEIKNHNAINANRVPNGTTDEDSREIKIKLRITKIEKIVPGTSNAVNRTFLRQCSP